MSNFPTMDGEFNAESEAVKQEHTRRTRMSSPVMMSNLGVPFRMLFETTLPGLEERLTGKVMFNNDEKSTPSFPRDEQVNTEC